MFKYGIKFMFIALLSTSAMAAGTFQTTPANWDPQAGPGVYTFTGYLYGGNSGLGGDKSNAAFEVNDIITRLTQKYGNQIFLHKPACAYDAERCVVGILPPYGTGANTWYGAFTYTFAPRTSN